MANELKHKTVGGELTQAEFEDVLLHVLESQAAGDIVYASSTTQLSRLAKGSDDEVLTLASGLPSWAAAAGGGAASGSYTGDATDDRQIAHGLGVIPTLVIITNLSDPDWHYKLQGTDNGVIYNIEIDGHGLRETGITAMDTTNFSVGKAATADTEVANVDGEVYHWVAIG